MTNPNCTRGFLNTPASFLCLLLLAAAALPGATAADAARRQFNLPASSVEASLKLLSQQSGVEVLYPTNFARGVRTNPVSGNLTPREALEQMLVGTGLSAAQDEKSGALTVRRAPEVPSAKKAAARVESTPASRAASDSAVATEETVMLSPFEVVTDTRGYFSANTMSGTRFNSKLEDLASSMTVITKEQMSDFAMLDINDVFLYTANTEGTGDYTSFNVDSDGNVSDGVSTNPNSFIFTPSLAASALRSSGVCIPTERTTMSKRSFVVWPVSSRKLMTRSLVFWSSSIWGTRQRW